MSAKLIAIWLDAAEPALLEEMMANGGLPQLQALRTRGMYGRLRSLDHTLSETVYGMVLTGQPPDKTGTWNIGRFNRQTYDEGEVELTDYAGQPFFPQFDSTLRTCVFDVPCLPLLPQLNGAQVQSWGAHSPKVPPASLPPGLWAELTAKHGEHPAGKYNDSACLQDPASLRDLRRRLLAGLPRRQAVACDLLARADWDLFFMAFGEMHAVGHIYWPHPECLPLLEASGTADMMREVYCASDQVLGNIVTAAGTAARVVVFSTEGMNADNFDVPNFVLLPELLFRYSFPGCVGFDFDPQRAPSPESQAGIKNWVMEVWHQRRRPRPLETWLRDHLPVSWALRLSRLLGLQPPLYHPLSTRFWNFQPTTWTIPYRPYMKAFSLLSASDGYIRLNVRGRESHGLIAPEDFRRACADVTAFLLDLRDPNTGRPAVRKVVPIRLEAHDGDANAHAADLIVLWNSGVKTCLFSPRFGMLGPVPYHRASGHSPDGFLCASGPGIPRGAFASGSPLDVAPTILALAGSSSGHVLPGRCLIPGLAREAA